MKDVGGFPDFEIEFNKDAQLVDAGQEAELLTFLDEKKGATDLFVFSHGWNNDMDEARDLNQNFFGRVRAVLDGGGVQGLGGRKFAVATVLWPSKKFADRDLIAGGAASVGGAPGAAEVLYVQGQLEALKGAQQSEDAKKALEQAKQLVPALEGSPDRQKLFADLLRSVVRSQAGQKKNGQEAAKQKEDGADVFLSLPGNELLDRLKLPMLPGTGAPPPGGEAGGAAGIGSFLGSVGRGIGGAVVGVGGAVINFADTFVNRTVAAASNLANLTTYYQMKERAGLVGATGLGPLLGRIRGRTPAVKLHLLGHSFGGRLVTAAADADPPAKPNTMTLLQAAFSHNGFASQFDEKKNDGFFRKVVTDNKVAGPILISCSNKDWAVGLAYPLASRIAGQQASAVGGGPGDPYGGIGRNGALHTPEAVAGSLEAVGDPNKRYNFAAGHLYNLRADAIITGHSDICKDEVAYALLRAVATT